MHLAVKIGERCEGGRQGKLTELNVNDWPPHYKKIYMYIYIYVQWCSRLKMCHVCIFTYLCIHMQEQTSKMSDSIFDAKD